MDLPIYHASIFDTSIAVQQVVSNVTSSLDIVTVQPPLYANTTKDDEEDQHMSSMSSTSTIGLQSKVVCKEQNCMIENACFDTGSNKNKFLRLRLFAQNNSQVESIMRTIKGNNAIGFRENNVVLSGMDGVKSSRIPWLIEKNSTASFVVRWVMDNCGHDLGDGAVAISRLMRLFPDPPTRLNRLFVIGRPSACDKIFAFIADSLTSIHKRTRKYEPLQLECYARVYFGVRGVSYMVDYGTWPNRAATLEPDMRAFRDMYYHNADINPTSKRDTLLIMEKRKGTHFCNLGNITEMAAYLGREFPTYQVKVATWSDYNMREQLELMSRTRAMIAVPGSDIMNGIFLQDNSALVVFCRSIVSDDVTVKLDASNEVDIWFDRVSYVNVSKTDCNSSSISYWHDKGSKVSLTFVDFPFLKQQLQRLGI